MKRDVSSLFNKFAGREVPMIETPESFVIAGQTFHDVSVSLVDPNDATIQEMKKVAADNGMHLRIWFPRMAGTADYRTDRVNAHVEKGADGKYRVSNRFDIG